MVTELKRTTIFLTKGQHEELRKLAFEKRTSMSSLMREAILQMIEDEEDIRDGLRTLADEEGTVTLAEYENNRKEREYQNEPVPCLVKERRPKAVR